MVSSLGTVTLEVGTYGYDVTSEMLDLWSEGDDLNQSANGHPGLLQALNFISVISTWNYKSYMGSSWP